MKKFDWNQPTSRKDFLKVMAVGSAMGVVTCAVYLMAWYWKEIETWCEMTIKKIKTKFHR